MSEVSEDRAAITPVVFMAGVIGWLAITRPGNLDGPINAYQMTSTLCAVAAVGYIAWRFHGLIAAIATLILFRIHDPLQPSPAAFAERGHEAMLLVTLWVGMVAGSRQVRHGAGPWLLILIFAAAVSFFGWYGFGIPPSEDPVARERIVHLMGGLTILAFVFGWLGSTDNWNDRIALFAITIAVPAAGIIASRLVRGDWPRPYEGGEWNTFLTEWKTAIDSGSWKNATWCWTLPWVSVPLVLFGLWRTFARGRRQRQLSRSPGAWLITVTALASIAALGARTLADSSMLLAAVGTMLSAFGVADFVLAVVERIALAPPEPGPSDVPRVK